MKYLDGEGINHGFVNGGDADVKNFKREFFKSRNDSESLSGYRR